eukprot:GHVS01034353.1.p1 GENE.GHVS01034353.1~~GHVS01034353.1.p1  ORF type:complete len:183 (+),score=18.34 GHVS01034353.1:57-605(+)
MTVFYGEEDQTPPKTKAGKLSEGVRTGSYAEREGGSTTRTEVFRPRGPDAMKLLARAWENYVHPRAKKMWSTGGQLHRILDDVGRGCQSYDDPVLGDEQLCVDWYGEYSADEGLPVMMILQPVPYEGMDDYYEVLSHVNRVLVFLYADDSAFRVLEERTAPLTMACGNNHCVNMTHISLDYY